VGLVAIVPEASLPRLSRHARSKGYEVTTASRWLRTSDASPSRRLARMTLRAWFAASGAGGNDDLLCTDPSCSVCWLWPRAGEERAEWLARLVKRSAAPPLPEP
jgi:hypothetical protein